jgi:hypothetical protein
MKEKYHVEIHQARHTIDETAKDCAVAELRAKRAEEETIKLKEKYIRDYLIIDSVKQRILCIDVIYYKLEETPIEQRLNY